MATYTSKTYNFNPSAGEILLEAFGRCQVRPTELTATHIQAGVRAENLMLSEISNMQPNLWEVELKFLPLRSGVATYSLPAEIVQITDLFIRSGNPATDRICTSISRSDYAALPNKTRTGPPNQFWFNRRNSPEITFYLVPDTGGPYTAGYYSVRQTQDVELANGNTVEVPYRWLECFICGVAWILAKSYAPQRVQELYAEYERQLGKVQAQDTEDADLYITPGLGGYFR